MGMHLNLLFIISKNLNITLAKIEGVI